MKNKTVTIILQDIKDPDTWGELIEALDLSEAKIKKHFEFVEYASIEVVINEKLEIVGGRIL